MICTTTWHFRIETYLLARILKRGSRTPGNVFGKRCCCLSPWNYPFSQRFPHGDFPLFSPKFVFWKWVSHSIGTPMYTAAPVGHFVLLCRLQNVVEKSNFLLITMCAGECIPLCLHQLFSPYYTTTRRLGALISAKSTILNLAGSDLKNVSVVLSRHSCDFWN